MRAVPMAVAAMAALFGASPARADSDAEVKAFVSRAMQSWSTMDTGKIEPYYAADPDAAWFDVAPMKYTGWAEYKAGVQKFFFDPNKSIGMKMNDDLKVRSKGRLAYATFTFGVDITPKQGSAMHLDGRWTMALEKRKGGWVVVHEHVSVPLPPSPK